jgi:hypothetical protein
MDPSSLSDLASASQEPTRLRRCLLKGCQQCFHPSRPQSRYCSPPCQQAARRWRRWHAQQKYRASDNGRQHRRQQARRYRQRQPPPAPLSAPNVEPDRAEGKRLLEKISDFPVQPCDRPGCYVLFNASTTLQPRRFCCASCRQALRCVLDREARRRLRRRRGLQQPGPRRRTTPRRC